MASARASGSLLRWALSRGVGLEHPQRCLGLRPRTAVYAYILYQIYTEIVQRCNQKLGPRDRLNPENQRELAAEK